MVLVERGSSRKLGRVEEVKTVLGMYFMREEPVFHKKFFLKKRNKILFLNAISEMKLNKPNEQMSYQQEPSIYKFKIICTDKICTRQFLLSDFLQFLGNYLKVLQEKMK